MVRCFHKFISFVTLTFWPRNCSASWLHLTIQGNKTSRHDDDRPISARWTGQSPGAAAEPNRSQESQEQMPDRDLMQLGFQTLTDREVATYARPHIGTATGVDKSATTDFGLRWLHTYSVLYCCLSISLYACSICIKLHLFLGWGGIGWPYWDQNLGQQRLVRWIRRI